MTHRFFKSVLCSLTIMLLCACPKAPQPQNETENPPTPPTKVLDYLSLSVQYMLNQQKPDGFFNYEYNFITGNYTNWDNVIHQTRAGYVLAKYYSFLIRNNIDPAMAPVVRESVAKSLNGYVAASLSHQNMPGQLISFYYNKGGSIMLPPVRSEAASEEQKTATTEENKESVEAQPSSDATPQETPAPAVAPPNPAPAQAEPDLLLDIPAPVSDQGSSSNVTVPPPPPPANTLSVPTTPSNLSFSSSGAGMNLSTPPSEQILGKVSSDIFREMAEMERENSTLMLQLKREQLRSEIDALKTTNRQMLFDEIERREKMTQARLEWELAQDLKRQEALERKQRAEIRQKQIEAALKREEDRRIQKMKDEEAARIQKEKEEKERLQKQREELRKKYDAASLVRLNNLKPVLMAATRPAKIKRSASSRVPQVLTATGEDLLTKKKAGEALTVEIPEEEKEENKAREPASTLYAVSEIRGTADSLIAKLISKKDKTTFFAKKSTILPTGHTVVDIDKDFVLVQIGKETEMIGFPSAGLLSDQTAAVPAGQDNNQSAQEERNERDQRRAQRRAERRRRSTPISANAGVGPTFSGASLAK